MIDCRSINRLRLSHAAYTWSENDLLFTHASPQNPDEWGYLWYPEQIETQFEVFAEQICFVGHTHKPYIYVKGTNKFVNEEEYFIPHGLRCIVNIGSVGQPRDGNPRASYYIFDDKERLLKNRRVEYDFRLTAQKIQEAKLPEVLGQRLISWIVKPMNESQNCKTESAAAFSY